MDKQCSGYDLCVGFIQNVHNQRSTDAYHRHHTLYRLPSKMPNAPDDAKPL